MTTNADKLLSLVRRWRMVRPRDLDGLGIPRIYLTRLHRSGLLERPSRGVYVLADGDPTEHHTLAEACKRVPHGVVCLLSALRFHDLTTPAPFEVWLAVDRKAWLPKVDSPPLRIVRFSGKALTTGAQKHCIEGVPVRVYSPAKTVADCFKYRNKVGAEIAVEALKDYLKQHPRGAEALWRF